MNEPDPTVTRILEAAGSGDREAAEQLIRQKFPPLELPVVRRIALPDAGG